MNNGSIANFNKEKGYQEQGDQPFTNVLKDILSVNIPQDKTIYKMNDDLVSVSRFTFGIYSEVLEHLFSYGYTTKELFEDRPDRLHYELLDAINEIVMYGEEINRTFFEVVTKDHWGTVSKIMKELEILLED